MTNTSAGKAWLALEANRPLQTGTINAYCAMQAEKVGHQAIYLSGGEQPTHRMDPDLGITGLNDALLM